MDSCVYAQFRESEVIGTSEYSLYIPADLDYNKQYPLVYALSPRADAQLMIRVWKGVADKFKWIILASKQNRNGMGFEPTGGVLINTLKGVIAAYPVDKSKIIASGFSGGGMSAHYLAMNYPDLIKAVVVNTGMIHEDFASEKNYQYPKNKIAVFIASSSDFRYQEMKRDSSFLEGLDWRVKWIEFSGGHTIARDSIYQEAAEWLEGQLD